MHKIALLFLFLIFTVNGWAQRSHSSDSPGQVFFGYSFLNGGTFSKSSGWDAQLMGNLNDWLGLKADFSGQYKSVGPASAHEYNILFGPQVSDHIDRLTAFAHGLLGIAHFGVDNGGSGNGAAWVLGAGFDYDLNSQFAVRFAQIDYHGAHVLGDTQKDFRYAAGIVFKFQ